MSWKRVQAGSDVLSQYTKKKPVDAIAELIWNSLDAEADEVVVDIETASIGVSQDEAAHVVSVTVTDNGHGITPNIADSTFTVLGNSWKKGLNGRSLNGLCAIHGQEGRGRFFAYSLGHQVKWTTVSQPTELDHKVRIEISGDSSHIEGFEISEPVVSDKSLGTTVKVNVEQGRPLSALLSDDVHSNLAAIFAPHLLYNPDLSVKFDGVKIDPRPFIIGEPRDVTFNLSSPEVFDLIERPILTLVDWNDEMRTAPGVVLCTAEGAYLLELEKTAPPGNVKTTAYLKWSKWATSGSELLMVRTQHPEVINWAIDTLKEHVAARSAEIQVSIIEELKQVDAYPYADQILDPLELAEREMFDLVAVTARSALRSKNPRQVTMTAQLLRVALQERPEELDRILEEAFSLSIEERRDLAQLLNHSSLSAIVGAATEVTKRMELLAGLRHIIYDPDVSDELREVDQLHPLIKDNTWVFGEVWQLAASEKTLKTIIRGVVDSSVVLEDELELFLAEEPKGDRRRIDLLLQRTHQGPGNVKHRLVVELKRPSTELGFAEYNQINGYANRLSSSQGLGPSKWTYILIGSGIKEELKSQMEQTDRNWGHLVKNDQFDLFITTWGRLIDECESRYNFYREQLKSSATVDESINRMRERYEHLLPNPRTPTES